MRTMTTAEDAPEPLGQHARRVALTLGQPLPDGGFGAVSDRGERHEVGQEAVHGWHPVPGQRVVATLGDGGRVRAVEVPRTRLALPPLSPPSGPGSSRA